MAQGSGRMAQGDLQNDRGMAGLKKSGKILKKSDKLV